MRKRNSDKSRVWHTRLRFTRLELSFPGIADRYRTIRPAPMNGLFLSPNMQMFRTASPRGGEGEGEGRGEGEGSPRPRERARNSALPAERPVTLAPCHFYRGGGRRGGARAKRGRESAPRPRPAARFPPRGGRAISERTHVGVSTDPPPADWRARLPSPPR